MTRRPDESAAVWYERAIVARSMAAAHLDELDDRVDVTAVARDAITKRAAEAAADLDAAMIAYLAERKAHPD